MEYSPMTMSMKGVFNLLERINLRNTGRSGLDDKVRFEEKISFKLTKANGKEVKGN
jgi:hypothetical protein